VSSNATTSRGDAAKAKRVYAIDLDKAVPGKPLAKKRVIDLLAIGNARGLAEAVPRDKPFRFPFLTTESIQVLDRTHVVIVNDNNYPATGGRGPTVTDATNGFGWNSPILFDRDADRTQGRGTRVRHDPVAGPRVAGDCRRRPGRADRPQRHRQVIVVGRARRHAAAR
jgi:hypothetical protein